jgi:hypothetical protein
MDGGKPRHHGTHRGFALPLKDISIGTDSPAYILGRVWKNIVQMFECSTLLLSSLL